MAKIVTIWGFILFVFVLNVGLTESISEDAYFVLSEKIEAVNSEVIYLRNELKSTNARVEQLEHDKKLKEDVQNQTKSNIAVTIIRKAWKNEKTAIRTSLIQINQFLSECHTGIENVTADLQEYNNAFSMLRQETRSKHTETTERIETLQSGMESLDNLYNAELAKFESKIDDNARVISFLQRQLESTSNEFQQSLSGLSEQLSKRLDSIDKTLAQTESCQSGNDVGAPPTPQSPFPYTVTVRFNPPFNNVPAFVYGTRVPDVVGHFSYEAILDRLTRQSFTLSIRSWPNIVAYGVRVSWMACPK